MDTLKHPIVEDRIIHGEGTSLQEWQQSTRLTTLAPLHVTTFFPQHSRICIVAPHPDDEILGCAGLIQQLDAAGYEVVIMAVTNGTASHPESSIYSPEQLNQLRPQETREALQTLGLQQNIQRIGFNIQDGAVAEQREQLMNALRQQLQSKDVLIATFEQDGHPDHEITGQVVKQLAKEQSLPYLQVLIWAWHWANPDDDRIPWHKALKLPLSPQQLQRKAAAAQCFHTQLVADPSTGQAPIISDTTLARLLQPWEVYVHD